MRGSGVKRRKSAPRSTASTYYNTTSSSSTNQSRETDENSPQSSIEYSRCTRNYIMGHPNFFTDVSWSVISHQAGDTPRTIPLAHKETSVENIGLKLKTSFDTTYTVRNQERTSAQNIYDTKRSSPSTYDSHSTQDVASKKHYENPIKFDRWINDQAIADITNRLPSYHTTQLIRQTTNEGEKNIIWIYSYKNQNFIRNDGNTDNSSTAHEYTSPSEKDSEYGDFLKHQSSEPCDSPRYPKPDTHSPVYIPTMKISTRLSLEPVEEVLETGTYTNEPSETAVNPHISKETLFSVNQWIDGSVHDTMSSVHLPGEIVQVQNEKTDISEKEMQAGRNTTYQVLSLRSELSETNKMESTSEQSCAIFNQKPPDFPKELEWRLSDREDKYCKWKADSILSRYIDSRSKSVASASRNVMPPSWVNYPTTSPCDTQVLNDSVTRSEESKKKRRWRTLSRCFCKCFM